MSSLPVPRRGEIWLIGFDQTVGSEINKTRPAAVVSSDAMGVLPVKLVVPLTGWQDNFAGTLWHVRIEPDALNHLDKVVSADTLQLRCVAVERFIKRKGRLSAPHLEEIVAAIAAVVEYPSVEP
jgi:mRNA interferase MazF